MEQKYYIYTGFTAAVLVRESIVCIPIELEQCGDKFSEVFIYDTRNLRLMIKTQFWIPPNSLEGSESSKFGNPPPDIYLNIYLREDLSKMLPRGMMKRIKQALGGEFQEISQPQYEKLLSFLIMENAEF